MDTQAPLLNFPTGSIMGVGELDAESVELIPGAASALYGPNAFNGIVIMSSKNPFEYQGLSAQVKQGITSSEAGGTDALGQYSIRYAKAFNNKFAFKVNFSYLTATDWTGNDYTTDRNFPESTVDLSGTPGFDGLNLYGDETPIPTGVPSIGTIRRTGFTEEDMLNSFSDGREAKTIKGDAAIHYRINDKMEALYNYRYGGGSSIYQGTEKYILRNFNQQFHKLELRGDNFFVRGYISATDAGKSYNLSALGGFANETYNPTRPEPGVTGWATEYVLAMQGYIPSIPAGNHDAEMQAFFVSGGCKGRDARQTPISHGPAHGVAATDAGVGEEVFQTPAPCLRGEKLFASRVDNGLSQNQQSQRLADELQRPLRTPRETTRARIRLATTETARRRRHHPGRCRTADRESRSTRQVRFNVYYSDDVAADAAHTRRAYYLRRNRYSGGCLGIYHQPQDSGPR
jgi:outer membrane receptor protein involved in Fe transport